MYKIYYYSQLPGTSIQIRGAKNIDSDSDQLTRNRSEHHQPIDNEARAITATRCTQIFLLSE